MLPHRSRSFAASPRRENAQPELSSVEGVGPVVAEALVDFFHEPHNREALDDLLSQVSPKPFLSDAKQTEWSGKPSCSPAASKP